MEGVLISPSQNLNSPKLKKKKNPQTPRPHPHHPAIVSILTTYIDSASQRQFATSKALQGFISANRLFRYQEDLKRNSVYKLKKFMITSSKRSSQTHCKDSYLQTGYSATKRISSGTLFTS
ncbi:unnamed protein product [Arabidopsis lyrata]|uniref:Uncharacterized protein n=1 Tax=Arabidopsis lyrata subsp. lyrata TaxID=81972 RepID=D7L9B6_ARALL|nr:hypothetical protein ARALYDRAFT_899388 [Arabidopsis lyrata subsp. lyrata]CAH8262027.1 unnamed protein product [Arabidopsis lyrata]